MPDAPLPIPTPTVKKSFAQIAEETIAGMSLLEVKVFTLDNMRKLGKLQEELRQFSENVKVGQKRIDDAEAAE